MLKQMAFTLAQFPPRALLTWLLTCACQLFIGYRAWKRDRPVSLFLVSAAFLSVFGFARLALSGPASYPTSYYMAGFWDEISSIALFMVSMEDLRKRARPRRRGLWLPIVACLSTALLAFHLTDFSEMTPSVNWVSTHRFGHMLWLWASLMIVCIPGYMSITMARPDRRIVLNQTALAIYVATHSGLADRYLSPAVTSLSLYKTAADTLYFFPLMIWLISSFLEAPKAASQPEALQEEFAL